MEKGTSKNKSVQAVPEGFHTVTPYLIVDGAARLLEFIKNAFGGEVTFNMQDDNKRITHATVKVGNSLIMVSDTMEGMKAQTSMLYLYLDDVDTVYKKAVQAKGKSIHEPSNEFYGDRAAAVQDEWGNVWWVATHVEDVGEEELRKRAEATMAERKKKHEEIHA